MEGGEGCGFVATSKKKAIYNEGNPNLDNT
jgi:hypothetical protein